MQNIHISFFLYYIHVEFLLLVYFCHKQKQQLKQEKEKCFNPQLDTDEKILCEEANQLKKNCIFLGTKKKTISLIVKMKPYYSINTNRLPQNYFCIAVIARILRVYEYEGSHRTNTLLWFFFCCFVFYFNFCDVSFDMCISL